MDPNERVKTTPAMGGSNSDCEWEEVKTNKQDLQSKPSISTKKWVEKRFGNQDLRESSVNLIVEPRAQEFIPDKSGSNNGQRVNAENPDQIKLPPNGEVLVSNIMAEEEKGRKQKGYFEVLREKHCSGGTEHLIQ